MQNFHHNQNLDILKRFFSFFCWLINYYIKFRSCLLKFVFPILESEIDGGILTDLNASYSIHVLLVKIAIGLALVDLKIDDIVLFKNQNEIIYHLYW